MGTHLLLSRHEDHTSSASFQIEGSGYEVLP